MLTLGGILKVFIQIIHMIGGLQLGYCQPGCKANNRANGYGQEFNGS
jgi:hypothetical protein